MGMVLYSPGMGETLEDNQAGLIETVTHERGDEFRFLSHNWKQGTIDDWAFTVEHACAEYDPTDTEIIGMSLGSVAAFVAVSRMTIKPKRLVLLSLSARFHEDLPNIPAEHLRRFTDDQMEAFRRHRFNDLAPRITCPTLLMMGQLEYKDFPTLAVRAEKAEELIPNGQLVIAKEAGHSLRHAGYKRALMAHL